LLEFLKLWNPIQSFWVVIIKKELLLNNFPFINLDKTNKMFWALDYYLWTKIIPNNIIYFLDKPLFLYRLHDNNFIKNISIMNSQIELIYKNIISKTSNKELIKTCNFFIYNNKAVSNFFEWTRYKTIKNIFKSFYYNQTKNIIERFWILFLSCMPNFLKNYVIKKYKSI
jgi:hypothetical protein